MTLHPEARRFLDEVRFPPNFPDAAMTDSAMSRDYLHALRSRPPRVGGPRVESVRDVDVGEGVIVRIYDNRGPAHPPTPAVLHVHGGGWVTGSLEHDDALCRHICSMTGLPVVSVEYRLAPEHAYPTPLSDVDHAWQWVKVHATSLNIDRARVGAVGLSAGANLVAALTLRDRDERRAPLSAQALIYPVVDAAMSTESYRTVVGCGLDHRQMAWFWSQYAPEGVDRLDPSVSPMRAKSHAGLPPALVLTAEHDPLRDDGAAYAQALSSAGVETVHVEYPGQIHGFVNALGLITDASRALDSVGDFLARTLGKNGHEVVSAVGGDRTTATEE